MVDLIKKNEESLWVQSSVNWIVMRGLGDDWIGEINKVLVKVEDPATLIKKAFYSLEHPKENCEPDINSFIATICKIFHIDMNNMSISDALILLPSFNKICTDLDVAMMFGNWKEYHHYTPIIENKEDWTYIWNIKSHWGMSYCLECEWDLPYIIHNLLKRITSSNDKILLQKHYLKIIENFKDRKVEEAKIVSSLDIDSVAEYLGIDLKNISESDLFAILPRSIQYEIWKPAPWNKIRLNPYLKKQTNWKYSFSYIVSNMNYNEIEDVSLGQDMFSKENSSLEEIVRYMYNHLRMRSQMMHWEDSNLNNKWKSSLQIRLEDIFGIIKQDKVSSRVKLRNEYNDSDEQWKDEIRGTISQMINLNSSNAYAAMYWFCLASHFELPIELRKEIAIQLIQTWLIGKLDWAYWYRLGLKEAFEKEWIDIKMTKDHVVKKIFTMEEIWKITEKYNISKEKLSTKLLDVFLLYSSYWELESFIKSKNISTHNIHLERERMKKILWEQLSQTDKDYIILLQNALMIELEPEKEIMCDFLDPAAKDEITEDTFLIKPNYGNNRDFKLLDVINHNLGIPFEEVVELHKYNISEILEYEKSVDWLSMSSNIAKEKLKAFRWNNGYANPNIGDKNRQTYHKDFWMDKLLAEVGHKWLIQIMQESLYKNAESYLSKFNEFVRDVTDLNQAKFESKLFIFENDWKFIVTDSAEKYPEIIPVSRLCTNRIEWCLCLTSDSSRPNDDGKWRCRKPEYYNEWLAQWSNDYLAGCLKALNLKNPYDIQNWKFKFHDVIVKV